MPNPTPNSPENYQFLWWLLFGKGALCDIKVLLISRGRDKRGNLRVSLTVPYIYEDKLRDILEKDS